MLRMQTACLIAAINANLTPNNYKLFAEWLDAYEYVNPDDRLLHPGLTRELADHVAIHSENPTGFFSLWIAIDILYHNASKQKQQEILSWILDSNNLAIHPQ